MVEIIPKPIEKIPLWQAVFWYFSFTLLVGVIIGYFVLARLEKRTDLYLQNLDQKLSEAKTPEITALEKEVLAFQRKISDFDKIFKKHKLNSKFFQFLEEKTHPRVSFSELNLNSETLEVSLSGQAENFSSLGQQLEILEKEDLIKKFNFSKISLGREGQIEFSLDLKLDEKMLSW